MASGRNIKSKGKDGVVLNKQEVSELFQPYSLTGGHDLAHRLVVGPLDTNSATSRGEITPADLAYAQRRHQLGSLYITGNMDVETFGRRYEHGVSIASDLYLPGLTQLAQVIKSAGSLAVAQIGHAGRFAEVAMDRYGMVYGPSDMTLYWPQPHHVQAMSPMRLEETIENFAQATQRAIVAGFDGVEINGGKRYLLQQFFSRQDNQRSDDWGQSLAHRARLALSIVEACRAAASAMGRPDFLIGYRFAPEEVQGSRVGFTIDDTLYLVEQLVQQGVSYLHSMDWGQEGYRSLSRAGINRKLPMNRQLLQQIQGRVPLIVSGGIHNARTALDALNYGDLVALGTISIVEPDFTQKIQADPTTMIYRDAPIDDLDLALPIGGFQNMDNLFSSTDTLTSVTRTRLQGE